jgi:hypothetical protein
MSKTKISEYSTTNALNTDIGGIDIDENCLPSNLNDSIREVMVHLKNFQSGASGDSFTNSNLIVSGGTINGATIGATTASTGAFTNLSYTGTLTGSTGILNIGSGQIYKDANGRVGLGTDSPLAQLDVVDRTGNNNRAIVVSRSDTDAASKSTAINIRHWLNAEEPVCLIGAGIDGNTASDLRIGGGFSNLNSATSIAFFTAADNATTLGSERMRITSAGNVGIGTTAPRVKFDVVSASASPSWSASANTAAIFENNVASAGRSYVSIVGRSAGQSELWFADEALENVGRVRYDHTADAMSFWTNGNERARIDSSGNLLVGTTTIPFLGETNGVILRPGADRSVWSRNTTGSASHIGFYNPNGLVGQISTSASTTTYSTSSDYRLKENIVDAPSASDSIDAIQIRSFDWKADGSHQKYGVIAQELESIAPEAVSKGETEDDMWGVDYSKLVPMLIKEVQSLRARVAQLEGE